jgi:hypothetical protein
MLQNILGFYDVVFTNVNSLLWSNVDVLALYRLKFVYIANFDLIRNVLEVCLVVDFKTFPRQSLD